MTHPAGTPPPASPPPRPDGGGAGVTAMLLVGLGAAAVFWAGLTLGSGMVGRNDQERAAIEAFTETYQRIADDFIGTPLPETLLEGAIEGMFEALDDPNSRYMPPDEYESALDNAMGEFEGIGAVMGTEGADGEQCEAIEAACRLRVLEVLAGAPAEEAGLLAGDVVTSVDGTSLAGSTIDDSVRLIRGPRGSQVMLTLERDGTELELPITRDTVVADDVHAATLADGRVGYIAVDNFSANAADEFEQALRAHLAAGVEGMVIDVRDDPGGFVEATVEMSSQFLDDGVVFWEEDAQGSRVAVDVIDDGLATDEDLSVVVLVNGGSASASEILAGALQDAGRAALVGEPTFGKGTVQEWNELPGENGGYRLSVAKWLTRDKRWIDRVGLTPDVPVELEGRRYLASIAGADPEVDSQLRAAVAAALGEPLPSLWPPPSAPSEAPSAEATSMPGSPGEAD